jgi:hypothetical protein
LRNRILTLLVLAVLAVAFAPSASAATLGFDRSCFRPGTTATLSGTGYTPNGLVAVGQDGTLRATPQANGVGAFATRFKTPSQSSGSRLYNFQAIDVTNTAIQAATQVRITALDVTIRPTSGSPGRVRRIGARGFIGGRTLYAHARRGRSYKVNVRVARLRGPCAKASAHKRILKRRGTPPGTYRVQFDARRRYRRCSGPSATRACVIFRVTVFRTFSSNAAGAASTGERWEQVSGPPLGGESFSG